MALCCCTLSFAQQDQSKPNPRKVGSFRLAKVVDGDTLRVDYDGRIVSLRLLGIDTEECFYDDQRQARAVKDFPVYVKEMQGDHPRPTKFPTPFGEAARAFAEKFFQGVTSVEVENDHPKEKTGHFGRLLSYVFVVKNGKRLHYNVEAVRAGYSPYYVKYGRSRSYEAQFKAAEAEAKEAKRGVWGDWQKNKCYPDYNKRLQWWATRAQMIDEWRQRTSQNAKLPEDQRKVLISMSDDGSLERLTKAAGRQVELFATIDTVRHPVGSPSVVVLSTKRGRLDVALKGRVNDGGRYQREFVIVRGTVELKAGSGQPCLKGAVLVKPELKVQPVQAGVNPTPKPKQQPNNPRPRNQSRRRMLKSFVYEGTAEDALALLVSKHGANVVVSAEAKELLKKDISVSLTNVSVTHVVMAVTKAAGAWYESLNKDSMIIKTNPRVEQTKRRAEISKLRQERDKLRLEAEIRYLEALKAKPDNEVLEKLGELFEVKRLREKIAKLERELQKLRRDGKAAGPKRPAKRTH